MDAPLVITADHRLRELALRACAAAGVRPQVVGPAEARSRWRSAAAVLVGSDAAGRCAELGLPRRSGVLLVATGHPPWELGVAIGAEGVFAADTDDDMLIEALDAALDGGREACLISVIGGTGGSWASTFAAGLGLAAARRGLRSVLLDVDPLGGGVDLVLGAEHVDGLRWPQIDTATDRLAAGALADVLPVSDGLAVLSWTRDGGAARPSIAPVLRAAAGDFDVIVADVSRRLDDAGAEVIARSVLTIVTVPTELRACAAARLQAAELRAAGAVVAVACERSRGLHRTQVGELLDVPVVGSIRADRRLRAAVDGGLGPGRSRTLRRAAAAVLDLVGLEGS